MRSVSYIALLMVACVVQAAPAPVWRERASPETAQAVMLAKLRTSKISTGPDSHNGGLWSRGHSSLRDTWTLTLDSIEGKKLINPVLTFTGGNGEQKGIYQSSIGMLEAADVDKKEFNLQLFGERGADGSMNVSIYELDLPLPTAKR